MESIKVNRPGVLPPMSHLFKIFEIFEEVPLPNGQVYRLSDSKLWVKTSDSWSESDLSVNSLLNLVNDLSGSQLREILQNSVGNAAAIAWREKILSYTL